MVKRTKIDNVLDVKNVIKLIFGKKKQINIIASSTGSNYGLMKVILYGSSVFFPGIADQNYIASRITGLTLNRRMLLIFQNANTLFMMGRISIRMDALSV